jgi:hypothetical protein
MDLEFELLLRRNTKITIDNIIRNTEFEIIKMGTHNDICVKVDNLIDGTII